MSPRSLVLLCALLSPIPAAPAADMIDLPTCTLHVRVVQGSPQAAGPRFVMMDGVPLSGAVFQRLGNTLSTRLDATSLLIDFPGIGRSALKGGHHGWRPLRECLRSYLATQPPHTLVVGDLALPVVAPLLQEFPAVQSMVVLNSVIRPAETQPPFPLSFLRCCPRRAVALGAITPGFAFENRIREVGLGRPERVTAEEIRALSVEIYRDRGLRRLARVMTDIELDADTDRAIADGLATPIPQLILWGAADPVLGPHYKKLLPLSSHQRLIVFPQARHFLMLDFADEITDAIDTWQTSLR